MSEDIFSSTLEQMDWDSEIQQDSSFVLLPEGEYNFTVTNFERGIHNGSEKLPRCPKAILTLTIKAPQGTATVTHNLFLSRKTEGMLCSFFTAIGQRKRGETLKPRWGEVVGSTGKCKLTVHKWKNDKGETMQSNQVKSFIEPAAFPAFQAGKF